MRESKFPVQARRRHLGRTRRVSAWVSCCSCRVRVPSRPPVCCFGEASPSNCSSRCRTSTRSPKPEAPRCGPAETQIRGGSHFEPTTARGLQPASQARGTQRLRVPQPRQPTATHTLGLHTPTPAGFSRDHPARSSLKSPQRRQGFQVLPPLTLPMLPCSYAPERDPPGDTSRARQV